MLSPEILTANIEALTRIQGACPNLGALRKTIRVTVADGDLRAELCTDHGEWHALDAAVSQGNGQHWLNVAQGPDAAQAIVIGSGLGHALDHAVRIGLTRILLIEPDAGLATMFLSRRDWRPWLSEGRLRLLTGPDYRGEKDVARFFDGLRDIPIITNPIRARLEPQAVASAQAVATRIASSARANGTARHKFAGPYLLQTLTNLPMIAREADVTALDGAFRGVPGIVVGAGPSLDENIDSLRRLQNRGVIVCADTALGPLLSGGVRPHIAVGVDSSALNAKHLIARDAGDVALAGEGSLHPSALECFRERTFAFRVSTHEPWPWLREGGITRGELKTWGSVLTSAFDLTRRMGCDPIVFAGADLAFTGMRPYCRGTIYDAMWQEWIDKGCTWDQLMEEYFSRQPELWLDDLHGVRTRTAPHLRSFRDWLIEQMAQGSGTKFVNATGAGILYGGTVTQATLAEVLGAMPATFDVRADVQARHAAFCRKSSDAARLKELLARARASIDNLPLDRWVAFAASTVDAGEIQAALVGGS